MLIAPQWLSPKCAQPAHKDVSCFSLISSENLPWILALLSIICFKGSAGQVITRSLIQECSSHKAPRPLGLPELPSLALPSDIQHSQKPDSFLLCTPQCCSSVIPQHFWGICRSYLWLGISSPTPGSPQPAVSSQVAPSTRERGMLKVFALLSPHL